MVNLKLFDLTKGNTILLAPMPDKSIRVKQLDLGYLSMSGAESQVEDLLCLLYTSPSPRDRG